MFFKPLNPWHMLEHTLRRSLLELFENRRRQNLGRFTALPAAIFRPIFLPFAGPCWWYFWFQMLQFYIWHSILLVVEPERTVIVRSGLVKKRRQDSTVLIQSALLRNEVAQPLPSFLCLYSRLESMTSPFRVHIVQCIRPTVMMTLIIQAEFWCMSF